MERHGHLGGGHFNFPQTQQQPNVGINPTTEQSQGNGNNEQQPPPLASGMNYLTDIGSRIQQALLNFGIFSKQNIFYFKICFVKVLNAKQPSRTVREMSKATCRSQHLKMFNNSSRQNLKRVRIN
jgi:hypothetical protein